MPENPYDNPRFFARYRAMPRSVGGLQAAGEWHVLRRLLPDLRGKRVLDLGCGLGWHCRYAAEQGARRVVGVDVSERMLAEARAKTTTPLIEYVQRPIEEIDYPEGAFDVVLSSLALHYVASFEDVCRRVARCLAGGGDFVFSVEHPVFTARGDQEWHRDAEGNILHWPVDRYFQEGPREAVFLGERMRKYHRTLTTYVDTLLDAGLALLRLAEPQPPEHLMDQPGMRDELRRPLMLLIAARRAAGHGAAHP